MMRMRHAGGLVLLMCTACGGPAGNADVRTPNIARATSVRGGASASETASFYHLEEGSEVFPVDRDPEARSARVSEDFLIVSSPVWPLQV